MPSGPKVMVVEDDPAARRMTEKVLTMVPPLRGMDIDVISVADGQQALSDFAHHSPKLLIVDLVLPKVDGFELIRRLRTTMRGGKDVPILVTSAIIKDRKTLGDLQTEFKVELLLKPLRPAQLAVKVHEMLTGETAPRRAPRPAAEPRPALARGRSFRRPGAAAGPAAPAAPVARGLALRGLPALLFEHEERESSGALDLTRGRERRVIFLHRGAPIFAQSNVAAEALGHFLVGRGWLSAQQNDQVVAMAEQRGIRYGEAVIAAGLLDQAALLAEVEAQIWYRIAVALDWREGDVVFTTDPHVAEKVPSLPLKTAALVFEGLQRFVQIEQARVRLPLPSVKLVPLPRLVRHKARYVKLFGPEVVDRLGNQGATIGELLDLDIDEDEVVLQVDVLRHACLVEESRR